MTVEVFTCPSGGEHMDHHQGLPTKRKLDDGNPLLLATKKAKREMKGSNKRKLINGEEVSGGLMIIRDPPPHPSSTQPPSRSQPLPARAPSQPPAPNFTRPPPSSQPQPRANSQPPPKKFRADGSRKSGIPGKGKDHQQGILPRGDGELEEDIRQMKSEMESLRSQAIENGGLPGPSLNVAFQFPPPSGGSRKFHDSTELIPDQETPQLERNKTLRSDSTAKHTRRRSSISRGKRISTSYQNTGVIAQPHTSVADTSLYKHIDGDLPDSARARQLLIWCTARAPTDYSNATPSSSKPRPPNSSGKDPPLTPLNSAQANIIEKLKQDTMKMLAENQIDTSLFASIDSRQSGAILAPNKQNTDNRAREVAFTEHIRQARVEVDKWKEVAQFYNDYRQQYTASQTQFEPPLSAVAKGKQRATSREYDRWLPYEHQLSSPFRDAFDLASRTLAVATEEKPISRRISRDLPFQVDSLATWINSAMSTTNVAEAGLNQWFAQLSRVLRDRVYQPHRQRQSTSYLPNSFSSPLDPLSLMRTLTRIDAARPPARQGNAVRRAAREVERAGEAGTAERRFTGVPPATPRKATTNRRGTTPVRDGGR